MNRTILTGGFCVVTAVSSFAYATNGMRAIGAGPVQRSMGGAGTALPLDSTAAATNPAGVSRLNRRLDVSVTYFAPDVEYKAHSDFGMVTRDGDTVSSRTNPCWIPTTGLVLPLNDRLTFGASVQGTCGMGVDYPSNLYHNVTYTQYRLMRLVPALAWSVTDKLSIGGALSVDYAQMEYHAGPASQVPHEDGEAFGMGATIGSLYQLTDRISLGLAYETKQDFEDFTFRTSLGTDRLALDQPQSVACGLGIRPARNLRAAMDVVWIDWPQTVGGNLPAYTTNNSGAAAWDMDWDEQTVYRVGLEWDLSESLTLRGGYNYGKHPLNSSRAFENIAFPAIAEQHITAGCGIKLRKGWTLNAAFMYAPEVAFSTANPTQFIDRATTRMSQYAVDVGLAMKW
jgi:long-chain fatty acid transport protein